MSAEERIERFSHRHGPYLCRLITDQHTGTKTLQVIHDDEVAELSEGDEFITILTAVEL